MDLSGRVVRCGIAPKSYGIEKAPFQHTLVTSKKTLRGWWKGKRECTSERMLIDPRNGCSADCICCYCHGFPGYFQLFRKVYDRQTWSRMMAN